MLAQRAQAEQRGVKRDEYETEHGVAVQLWDTGCEVAKVFAETGSV
jgi:hypothetical protein